MNADFDRLTLTDVSRNFGRRRALSHVSFSCATGDIFGLLGHNGAGKSTLLAILATLLRPSSGAVRYGTRTAAGRRRRVRARLGLLGHELQLYPELTAAENLRFFARLYGLADVDAPRARGTRNRRARGPRRRRRVEDFRAACGSGSRSSGRCSTSRASCCSTSPSPVSTRPRRASSSAAFAARRRGRHHRHRHARLGPGGRTAHALRDPARRPRGGAL